MIKLKAMSETMMRVSNKNMDYMNTRGSQRDYYPHFTIDECIQGLSSFTSTVIQDTKDIGNRSAINAMNEAFSGDKDKVRLIQEGAIENIKEKVKGFFQKVWGFITSIISKIKDFFKRKLGDQKDKEPVDKVVEELNRKAKSVSNDIAKEAEEGTLKDIKVEVKDKESGEVVEELVIPKEVVKENPDILEGLITGKLQDVIWVSRPWSHDTIKSFRDMSMWYKESKIATIEKIYNDISSRIKNEDVETVLKDYTENLKEISTSFVTKMKELLDKKPEHVSILDIVPEVIKDGVFIIPVLDNFDKSLDFLKSDGEGFKSIIRMAENPDQEDEDRGLESGSTAKLVSEKLKVYKTLYMAVITMWQWYCRVAYAIYSDCDKGRNEILKLKEEFKDFNYKTFKFHDSDEGRKIIERLKAKGALSPEERYKEMTKNVE